ncbi:pro-sigmaK processing inhibitor BofA family protein [Paenibacillus sp. P96]|uniref:Pro-sigmaK processing inhibitor BofA family protein n=1 Tax=Paenibacillus zeirhizosphaerae TaxID=2987519 RepID=A0ABT9FWV9_9BACL|nr:pro-sigmaK processing inhibitor BofA family protein [Paenibacillus sp. P96]MDP4099214.1 pro-sigmaK processing inhibitor BofA family protein [Paenibacillus sp. P96]
MKMIAWVVLSISVLLLGYLFVMKKARLGWLATFGAHLAIAAIGIYIVNYSGWVTQVHIPLNAVTIGTVAILGLPGVGLLYGLKLVLFS